MQYIFKWVFFPSLNICSKNGTEKSIFTRFDSVFEWSIWNQGSWWAWNHIKSTCRINIQKIEQNFGNQENMNLNSHTNIYSVENFWILGWNSIRKDDVSNACYYFFKDHIGQGFPIATQNTVTPHHLYRWVDGGI